jgi:hypothetical protein
MQTIINFKLSIFFSFGKFQIKTNETIINFKRSIFFSFGKFQIKTNEFLLAYIIQLV